jgi:hypothetical protein
MTKLKGVACSTLLIVLASTAAWAGPSADLAGLTDREYVEYARDRFEWLAGEARAGKRLASKFHRECRPDAPVNSDAARACEVARAADQEAEQVSKEGRDLIDGLRKRLGTVPPWALGADARLETVIHKP